MLKEIVRYPLEIKGLKSSQYLEIKSPYDNAVIAEVAQADQSLIDKAIANATEVFTKTMSKMPAYTRSQILDKTADLIAENIEDLAKTIALEGGKPLKDARIEASRAINTFRIASQEASRINGEHIPMDNLAGNEGRIGITLREPIGVIAAITPFNFPLNLAAHKLAPAFAAGNTVVLKPSPKTPISSFKLANLMAEAGLPDGALQVIPCPNEIAHVLVSDPRLAMLTFTGSPKVGWGLRSQVAPGVRVTLELGGNAGLIVHDDADLKAAAAAATRGGYSNAGQTCISVQRVYVQEKIYDQFLNYFTDAVKNLKAGDPLDETVDVGPIIDSSAFDKTINWIEEATKRGAKIVVGGKALSKNIIEPTILVDTKPDMLVICQEVFGPIVSVMKYDTIDNAINSVNDKHFGLQAGIFTKNVETAFKAARKIDVAAVMVNDSPTYRADHMPYGGRKESGLGLEGLRYAIFEMTQSKFVCLNLPKLD